MEFGEILDGAISLFRRHFRLFFKLSLAVMWLPFAFKVYVQLRFAGSITPGMTGLAAVQSEWGSIVGFGLILVVLYLLGSLMLTAGSVRIISDSYLGREPQFGEVLGFAWSRIVPLFLVGFGKGVLFVLLFILCGVAFGVMIGFAKGSVPLLVLLSIAGSVGSIWLVLYVACGYMVTTPIVALEKQASAFDSFGRSWELTRGAKLRMLGFGIVAWFLISLLLPGVVTAAVGALILEIMPGAAIGWSIVASLIPIMLAPILPCVLTLIYYDQRVRREGFDIQLLDEQLGTG